MYVDNRVYYGHLTDSSNFETSHRHNDMYAIIDNRYSWTKKYVHADYETTLHYTPLDQVTQLAQKYCSVMKNLCGCENFVEILTLLQL